MEKEKMATLALASVLLASFMLPNAFAFSLGDWHISSLTGLFGFHFHYFIERLKLTFTFNKAKKTDIALSLAQMQLQKANEYMKMGEYDKAAKALEKYEKMLALANKEAENAKLNEEIMKRIQERMRMVEREQKMLQQAMMNRSVMNMSRGAMARKGNPQALKQLMEIMQRSQQQQKMLYQRILMRMNETWRGGQGRGMHGKGKQNNMPPVPGPRSKRGQEMLKARAEAMIARAGLEIRMTQNMLEDVEAAVSNNQTLASNQTVYEMLTGAKKSLDEAKSLYNEAQGLYNAGKYQLAISDANKAMSICRHVIGYLHSIVGHRGPHIHNPMGNQSYVNMTREERMRIREMMEKMMPRISKPLNQTIFQGECTPENVNAAFKDKQIPCRVVKEIEVNKYLPAPQPVLPVRRGWENGTNMSKGIGPQRNMYQRYENITRVRMRKIYLVKCEINGHEYTTLLNGKTCRMLLTKDLMQLGIPAENITLPFRGYNESRHAPFIIPHKHLPIENITVPVNSNASCVPEAIENYMKMEKNMECKMLGVRAGNYVFDCENANHERFWLTINNVTCRGHLLPEIIGTTPTRPGVVRAL